MPREGWVVRSTPIIFLPSTFSLNTLTLLFIFNSYKIDATGFKSVGGKSSNSPTTAQESPLEGTYHHYFSSANIFPVHLTPHLQPLRGLPYKSNVFKKFALTAHNFSEGALRGVKCILQFSSVSQ